jgi:hypothetical protein
MAVPVTSSESVVSISGTASAGSPVVFYYSTDGGNTWVPLGSTVPEGPYGSLGRFSLDHHLPQLHLINLPQNFRRALMNSRFREDRH